MVPALSRCAGIGIDTKEKGKSPELRADLIMPYEHRGMFNYPFLKKLR